ncbi:MAG: hypothetical protein H6578_10990 [Chitinophagales bacterium]|nr:hypothetical protein [Chitinophagales bacterium]
MREKKEKKTIDAFEADIDANFSEWTDEKQQDEYLNKIASQIGWIIIEFNRLEWQLTEVLKQYFCNDLPEIAAVYYNIISSGSFSQKVELLKDFYKVYGNGTKKCVFEDSETLKEWDKQVDTLISQLKTASQIRNKYAHCFWHLMDENKYVEFKTVIKHEDGLNRVLIRFNDEDLANDYELLDNLQRDLFNTDSVFNEAYTSS